MRKRGRDMKAVVMAGGEGSRLRPLTSRQPKPLVPVAGRPIMEHILLHLRRHQMREVIATVQYLGASIRNYFGDGSEQGVRSEERRVGKEWRSGWAVRDLKEE